MPNSSGCTAELVRRYHTCDVHGALPYMRCDGAQRKRRLTQRTTTNSTGVVSKQLLCLSWLALGSLALLSALFVVPSLLAPMASPTCFASHPWLAFGLLHLLSRSACFGFVWMTHVESWLPLSCLPCLLLLSLPLLVFLLCFASFRLLSCFAMCCAHYVWMLCLGMDVVVKMML